MDELPQGTIKDPCPYLAIIQTDGNGGVWYCRHNNCHRQLPGNAPHVIYPGSTCKTCMLVKLWPNAAMRDVPTAADLVELAKPQPPAQNPPQAPQASVTAQASIPST